MVTHIYFLTNIQVTIFGESAGSWSTMYHVLSPKSSGLFSAAVGQSGTPVGKLMFDYRLEDRDQREGQK